MYIAEGEQLFDEDDVYEAYDIDNETSCTSLNVIDVSG